MVNLCFGDFLSNKVFSAIYSLLYTSTYILLGQHWPSTGFKSLENTYTLNEQRGIFVTKYINLHFLLQNKHTIMPQITIIKYIIKNTCLICF